MRYWLTCLLALPLCGFNADEPDWTILPGLPTPRFLGPQVAAAGGRIYVIGGMLRDGKTYMETGKVEVFDPENGTWSERAAMPTARCNFAVAVADERIFAIGGNLASTGKVLGDVEEYDPLANRWTRRASMPTPRWHLAVAAIGGQIYAIGGRGGKLAFERYDVRSDTWTRLPDLSRPKENPFCAVVNGRLFVLGGTGPDGKEDYGVFEEYEPDSGRWLVRAPSPTARTDVAIASAGSRVIVIGGWIPGGLTVKVEAYDPSQDSWGQVAELPTPVSFAGAASIESRVFLAGGAKYIDDKSLAPLPLMHVLEVR